jgi:hypothetical protein
MTYYYQLIILAVNIAMARWHAHLIKDNLPIYHGWWTFVYFIIGGILAIIFSHNWFTLIEYAVLLCLIREAVFDISLNLFRHLPINYQTLDPKSTTDKQTRNIFGTDFWTPKLITFAALIILNCLFIFLWPHLKIAG